ncbi:MAG TPA: class I SAM-dependent methyltransferase [Draconibacterium sp.]|jgi:SAM-dependent methyltransferase|nr:class I SAM-dependent methyltransferase [Draconibacterium sp.]
MNSNESVEEVLGIDINSIDIEAYIENFFKRNGPDEDEYHEFYGLLDQVRAEDIEYIRKLISPILNQKTLIGFSHTKPFGYSGDFFIIEKIYQFYLSENEKFKKWDMFFQCTPAVDAVRNRKTLAIEIFEKLNKKTAGLKHDVMILGSGPVTETYEFLEKNQDSPLEFHMLDMDKRAIAYAKNKNRKYSHKMTFHNVNVIRFTPERKYDLIWSAGLFDYFKGKHFVYLLKKYYEYLKENGEMIIGNFNVENPSRRSMEILCDWFLYHRSADELKQFAIQAGIEESKIDVIQEPLGINLFLRVKK